MSLPLFRHEVVQARRARWLGAVVLDHPPGAAWGMALCALAAALVLATLANGEYTRRTPVAGVVAALHVEEDEAVPAGAELLAIRVPTATVHGDDGAAIAASVERRREATREAYAYGVRQTLKQTLEEKSLTETDKAARL